MERYHTP